MKRLIYVQLLHDGVQPGAPLDEPLHFGLQNNKGEVYPETVKVGPELRFEFVMEIKNGETDQPVFSGPFVHGPPASRFLYLSWKREGEHATPWGWRIKIPLNTLGWSEVRNAELPGMCLMANVTDRRPHTSEPVNWRVQPSARA